MAEPIPPPVICEHLQPVLQYLLEQGGRITFSGQPWSRNCRMWVYFDAVLDCQALQKRFALPATVIPHDHRGTHDGAERGLVCSEHHDAVIGIHPEYAASSASPVKRIGGPNSTVRPS
ncbi:MAG: hypothetical protein JWM97_2221 [Phycisphaerales bacterium]|nr:hypothetical protein [Phycisphaerales bacterium]